MKELVLQATKRQVVGSAICGRLRKEGILPIVIYGKQMPNVLATVKHNDLLYLLALEYSLDSKVKLYIDNQLELVRVKHVQRHHFKNKLLHADFIRI